MGRRPRRSSDGAKGALLLFLRKDRRSTIFVMTIAKQLFVRYSAEGMWHIAQSPDPVQGDDLGDVYLTRCWRWVSARDAAEHGWKLGGPSSNVDVCKSCLDAPDS